MTGKEFLEVQSRMDQVNEHGDTCEVCRRRTMMSQVARTMLAREEYRAAPHVVAAEYMQRVAQGALQLPGLN